MFLKDRLNITTERTYTDEGFLQVPARISRIGIQEYTAIEMGLSDREPNEVIRVFRPKEEVFKKESLQSFANKPVTDNHPPELVTAKNSKQFSVGHSSPEVVEDGIFSKTMIQVTDIDAISKIEAGKVELSNGYTADIDWTPGVTPSGEQFDAIQRNIKGNHIAIVERGRAGPDCRVADKLPETGDKVIMAKITIDGVDFEVSDQAAQAVGKLQASLKDAEEETLTEAEKAKKAEDEAEEAKKKAEKTEDSLKAKLDDAKSKLPTTDALDKLVTERTKLIDAVRQISPDIKWEGKDEVTIVKEVVAEKCSNVNMDSASPDYLRARFDILVEETSTNSQNTLDNEFSKQVTNTDNKDEDNRPAHVIARDKMMADSRDLWKKKRGVQ